MQCVCVSFSAFAVSDDAESLRLMLAALADPAHSASVQDWDTAGSVSPPPHSHPSPLTPLHTFTGVQRLSWCL